MSLEFISSSESYEEFLSLCVNPGIIEDRLGFCCQQKRVAENRLVSDFLRTRDRHVPFYVCLEVLIERELANRRSIAVLTVCRYLTICQFIKLQRLLIRLGVQIRRKKTGSQSISFLCRFRDHRLIEFIKALMHRKHISPHICQPLIHQCQQWGTGRLIDQLETLLERGVENIRLDCDSVNCDVIVEDVASMFYHPINHRRNVLSLLQPCRTSIRVNFNSVLYRKMVYHYSNNWHFNDAGFFNFDTTENKIYLPDFYEWQILRDLWFNRLNLRQLSRRILHYLDRNSHQRDVCDQREQTCDWCRVGRHVDDYLSRLIEKVSDKVSLFVPKRIENYGSSAEKTNIFLANEFDRLIILKNFIQSPTDPDQIIYTGNDPAYIALKDGEQQCNSSCLLSRFLKAITDSLPQVYSAHVFAPVVSSGETCVTIHFLYRGEYPSPAVKVSVDITIAVEVALQPAIICKGRFISDDGEGIVLLVPHRRGVGKQWILSYPKLERDIILAEGGAVARVYQLLKLLAALQHAKNNCRREIPRKSSLSSYALKTCLLHYIHNNRRPRPWQPEDTLSHAVGILQQFSLTSSQMTSYFNKDIVVFDITAESKQAVLDIKTMLYRMM